MTTPLRRKPVKFLKKHSIDFTVLPISIYETHHLHSPLKFPHAKIRLSRHQHAKHASDLYSNTSMPQNKEQFYHQVKEILQSKTIDHSRNKQAATNAWCNASLDKIDSESAQKKAVKSKTPGGFRKKELVRDMEAIRTYMGSTLKNKVKSRVNAGSYRDKELAESVILWDTSNQKKNENQLNSFSNENQNMLKFKKFNAKNFKQSSNKIRVHLRNKTLGATNKVVEYSNAFAPPLMKNSKQNPKQQDNSNGKSRSNAHYIYSSSNQQKQTNIRDFSSKFNNTIDRFSKTLSRASNGKGRYNDIPNALSMVTLHQINAALAKKSQLQR
jgi:hypothetical protein